MREFETLMARTKKTALISQILEKRGIEDVKTLTAEEQTTLSRWKFVLSGEVVTVDSLKEFCLSQIRIIESKCDGIIPLTTIQQAAIHVYINLLKAIEAPEAERKSLELQLVQELQS